MRASTKYTLISYALAAVCAASGVVLGYAIGTQPVYVNVHRYLRPKPKWMDAPPQQGFMDVIGEKNWRVAA